MIPTSIIDQVIDSQKERLNHLDAGMTRRAPEFKGFSSHALIISGIRRSGKSTLLQQMIKNLQEPSIYVNFEDPRLAGFDLSDFNRLHEIVSERKIESLFFDEIQNVDQWENYVRFRLDEGYHIYITGSNSSMLSRELGSKLTGRHISRELFPFSYLEFLEFTGMEPGALSTEKFNLTGGFPEMVKTGNDELLMHVFNDIVVRDISMRHNIKNTAVLQQLAVWLISNTGKPVTGNSLRKIFSVASSSSMMDYLSYFSDAYLFFFVPKFSYSPKVSLVNAKKVYAIDNGLINANSVSFSKDTGRLFENMVFMQLRRRAKEIWYFSEKKECDFVVMQKGKPVSLFQSCYQLTQENLSREIEGLTEAMDFFKLPEGTIITLDQSDTFIQGNKKISAIPFYKWVTE